jgi:hypothetical protein
MLITSIPHAGCWKDPARRACWQARDRRTGVSPPLCRGDSGEPLARRQGLLRAGNPASRHTNACQAVNPAYRPATRGEHADDGHQRNRDPHGITTGDPGHGGGASGLGRRTYGTSASRAAPRRRTHTCGHPGRSTGSADRTSPPAPAGRKRSWAGPLPVWWRTDTSSTRQVRSSAHPWPERRTLGSGVLQAPSPVLAADGTENHRQHDDHHGNGKTRPSDQDQGSRTSSITPSDGGCGAT